MSTRHDAGLQAVARVRRVREQDSRTGLRRAVDDEIAAETASLTAFEQLERARAFDAITSPAAFMARRTGLLHLSEELAAREREAGTARLLTAVALDRWHQDRGRLRAVELLLERRAAARLAEARRREAAELDDLAAQRWLRAEVSR